MKLHIEIKDEVPWLVDEDGKKLGYMTEPEIEDLYFSCSFALQELKAMRDIDQGAVVQSERN